MNYDKPCFVIDNGTNMIKCGLADSEDPSFCIQNLIGEAKYKKVITSQNVRRYYMGDDLKNSRGILSLKYPVERGVITQMDDQVRIWRNICDQIPPLQFEDQPLLYTGGACHSRSNMEKICEVMYEDLLVPSLFFSHSQPLSLLAYGEVTGCVADCGEGLTQVMCVYEGFEVRNTLLRIPFGGKDVTNELVKSLRESGHIYHTSSEWEIVREIKEDKKVMCVHRHTPVSKGSMIVHGLMSPGVGLLGQVDSLHHHQSGLGGRSSEDYDAVEKKLPDGNTIKISTERFRAPEIIFQPHTVGLDHPGIDDLIIQSIKSSDFAVRSDLYALILLTGGSSQFKDFNDRLQHEVRTKAPRDKKTIVRSPRFRVQSTWNGGALLSSLDTFKKDMCARRSEFEENGFSIILRKSFV